MYSELAVNTVGSLLGILSRTIREDADVTTMNRGEAESRGGNRRDGELAVNTTQTVARQVALRVNAEVVIASQVSELDEMAIALNMELGIGAHFTMAGDLAVFHVAQVLAGGSAVQADEVAMSQDGEVDHLGCANVIAMAVAAVSSVSVIHCFFFLL